MGSIKRWWGFARNQPNLLTCIFLWGCFSWISAYNTAYTTSLRLLTAPFGRCCWLWSKDDSWEIFTTPSLHFLFGPWHDFCFTSEAVFFWSPNCQTKMSSPPPCWHSMSHPELICRDSYYVAYSWQSPKNWGQFLIPSRPSIHNQGFLVTAHMTCPSHMLLDQPVPSSVPIVVDPRSVPPAPWVRDYPPASV